MANPATLPEPCNTTEPVIQRNTEQSEDPFVIQGRLGGQKSGVIRRERAQRLKNLQALITPELLQPRPQPQLIPQHDPTVHSKALKTLAAHIKRIDKRLSEAEGAKDLYYLAQARMKLFEQWAWLSGIARPIDPKVRSGQPRAPRSVMAEPIQTMPAIDVTPDPQD